MQIRSKLKIRIAMRKKKFALLHWGLFFGGSFEEKMITSTAVTTVIRDN